MSDPTHLPPHDASILRRLGEWTAAAAASPANQEKIAAWLRHDAGAPDRRVMVLAEIDYLQDEQPFFGPAELQCRDPWARDLERRLRLRQCEAEVLHDDHVVNPYVELHPAIRVENGNFGLPGGRHRESGADALAFNYQPPLQELTEAEFARLQPRRFTWDRTAEEQERERLEAVFGGILPVRRCDAPWQFNLPLTSTLLDLVGLEQFMMLMHDHPEGLHRLMAFLRDQQLAYTDWLEAEGVWPLNNGGHYVGAGSMGYTAALPQAGFTGRVRARDRWHGCESQESVSISPAQYREFVFPYLRAVAARYGRVYYGCCEPADPLLDCLAELPNLARVSVSPWANEAKMGEFCRTHGVAYSRKPSPNFFMAPVFDEAAVREHLAATVAAARGCRLEIIQRDVYTTHNQPLRFARWVELVREAARDFVP